MVAPSRPAGLLVSILAGQEALAKVSGMPKSAISGSKSRRLPVEWTK